MKNSTINRNHNRKYGKLKWLALWVLWLIIWQAIAMVVNNSLLLPSPIAAAKALYILGGTTTFYVDVFATVLRCVLSAIISFAAGCIFAYISYKCTLVRDFLSIPVLFFKSVPVMAIIIYLILLATSNVVPVLVGFLMCFPVVYTNVLSGLDSTDSKLLEMAQVFNFSRYKVLRFIYIPSSGPQIKSSISLIAGLSWKAVVTAEVLSIPQFSLGYNMINAKYYLETENLFAYIIVIVLLSMTFEKLTKVAINSSGATSYDKSKVMVSCGRGHGVDTAETQTDGGGDILCRKFSKVFEIENNGNITKKIVSVPDKTFKRGEVNVIMAPSGSGKTTLLNGIAGLIDFEGEITGISDDRVSMIFQEDRLLPWLNVYDNIAIVLQGTSKAKVDDVVSQAIKKLGIEEAIHKVPSQLSGGMCHRVAMGRALVAEYNLLLVDEPFRGLDNKLKKEIIEGIWREKTKDKTVIVVTHNREDAEALKRGI